MQTAESESTPMQWSMTKINLVKNNIRDEGSTNDLVLVFLELLVPTGTHWYTLVPNKNIARVWSRY